MLWSFQVLKSSELNRRNYSIEGNAIMKVIKLVSDIVVSVSGGVVTGVFGPKGATVLVVDFDNLREGGDLSVRHRK
jgi:hypothetical protein